MTQYNVILIHIIIKVASRYFKTNLSILLHFFKFPENIRPVTVIPVYFELILYESSKTSSC